MGERTELLDKIMRRLKLSDDNIVWCDPWKREVEYNSGPDKFNIDEYLTVRLEPKEWAIFYPAIKRKISERKNPMSRVEAWECLDMDGNIDRNQFNRLLKSRGANLD